MRLLCRTMWRLGSPFIYVNTGRESSTRRRGPRPAANITSQSADIDITLMRCCHCTRLNLLGERRGMFSSYLQTHRRGQFCTVGCFFGPESLTFIIVKNDQGFDVPYQEIRRGSQRNKKSISFCCWDCVWKIIRLVNSSLLSRKW